MKLSLFNNKYDNKPKQKKINWDDLLIQFKSPDVRSKKDGALFSAATFEGNRNKGNVKNVSMLVLDYDYVDSMKTVLAQWDGYCFALYSTYSHGTAKKPFAYRVVLPLSAAVSAAEYPDLWDWAYQQSDGLIDKSCKDASRMQYLPAVPKSREKSFVFHSQNGALLDWKTLEIKAKPKPTNLALPIAQGDNSRYAKMVGAAIDGEINAMHSTPQGGRNARLNQAAFALGQLCAAQWSRDHINQQDVGSLLALAASAVGLPDGESRKTINSGLTAGQLQPRATPEDIKNAPEEKNIKKQNQIAPRFELDGEGLWFLKTKEDDNGKAEINRIFVCAPLEIVAALSDEGGINEGLLLRFKNNRGRVHELPLLMEDLVGELKDSLRALVSRGLHIRQPHKSKTRDYLVEYFNETKPARRLITVDKTGWHGKDKEAAFILTGGEILGHKADVIFNGADTDIYAQAGSLNEWQQQVAKPCEGNSRMLFSISLVFSGVLMPHVNHDSAGANLWGESSIGKTILMMLAGSVWGNPTAGHFVSKWNATANGLEIQATQRNHTAFILDELGEVDPRLAGKLMYQLASGVQKTRSNADLKLQTQKTWRFPFLSSAEKTLSQHIEETGVRVYGGQIVRMVDVPADAGAGYGVFEELHGLLDKHDNDAKAAGAEFSDTLKQAAALNHGTAGRAFVLAVLALGIEQVKQLTAEYQAQFMTTLPTKISTLARRAAKLFSLTAAAGELAIKTGVVPWQQGAAMAAAKTCFQAWLKNNNDGSPEEAAIIAQVRLFIEQNEGRFRGWEEREATDQGRTINNQAGWQKEDEEGTVFYIKPEIFKTEVCKNYSLDRVCKLLNKCDALLTSKNRGFRFQTRKSGGKSVYAIKEIKLSGKVDGYNGYTGTQSEITNTINNLTNENVYPLCTRPVPVCESVPVDDFAPVEVFAHNIGQQSVPVDGYRQVQRVQDGYTKNAKTSTDTAAYEMCTRVPVVPVAKTGNSKKTDKCDENNAYLIAKGV